MVICEGVAFCVGWLVLATEHVGVLRALGWKWTDEDQVLLWLGAVDFSHLRFHEPRFYGQAYNSMAESVGAVPLLWLGVDPAVALPLVSTLASLVAWTVLAALAWRCGHLLVALTILALPLLIDERFLLIATMPRGFMPGIIVSTLAATVWLWRPQARFRTLIAVFLLGCGCSLSSNAVLIAVPFGAAVLYRVFRRPAERLQIGLGVLGAAAMHGLIVLFYVLHPTYVVHPSPNTALTWQHWLASWRSFKEVFGPLLPVDAWRALLLIMAVGTIAVLGHHRTGADVWLFLLAIGVLLGVGMAAESVAVTDPDRLYMPRARFFLALPFAASIVLLLLRPRRSRITVLVAALVLAGAVLSCLQRQCGRAEYIASAVAQSIAAFPKQQAWAVDDARQRCALIKRTATAAGLNLSIHWEDNRPVYACMALNDGDFVAIFPMYERRQWLIDQLKPLQVDRLMMADVKQKDCDRLSAAHWPCVPLAEQGNGTLLVEVRFPPQPLARAMGSLMEFYGGDPADWQR